MVGLVGSWHQMGRYTFAACALALFATFLQGCAAGSGGGLGSEAKATEFTPSDEPETRRRARIRLELAANYFGNGQPTVALDEVKQALAADPSYGDAFNLRGLIYMELGDLPQADESFRKALALRGADPNLLHNYGWLLCQQRKFVEADQYFGRALADSTYASRSKTLMARGLCQSGAGNFLEAEQTLLKSYELDAGNPVVAYHLAALLFRRNEIARAQFYIRRLNNSQFANAESLWLGIKVEQKLGDVVALKQLGEQLRKRFPESREQAAFERGAFNE